MQYIKAKIETIWIQTYDESLFIDDFLGKISENGMSSKIYTWSETSGLTEESLIKGISSSETDKSYKNLDKLFDLIKKQQENKSSVRNFFILKDLHMIIDSRQVKRFIRDLKEIQSNSPTYIMVLSPVIEMPLELEKLFRVFHYEGLKYDDIQSLYNSFDSIYREKEGYVINTDKDVDSIIKSCIGLTYKEINSAFALSLVKHKQIKLSEIQEIKIQSIEKSGVLEFKIPSANFDDIGGNENFKKWFKDIECAFSDKAREFGVNSPKGYLAVGIPGACKTMGAEAIAKKMNMPLILFKPSRIFSKLVGESEKKIEQALRLVKSMAPCVFLLDEVEKILGSGGASSNATDSGVTSRIMASIMQFTNDNDSGILTIMTSNDISQLPPEFTRAGRLDAIWYFGIPNEEERKQIFKIHYNIKNKKVSDKLIDFAAAHTENYTGAEIKSIVQSTILKTYKRFLDDGNENVTKAEIDESIKETIPLFNSYKERIYILEDWAKNRARYASAKINDTNKNNIRKLNIQPIKDLEY